MIIKLIRTNISRQRWVSGSNVCLARQALLDLPNI